VRSEEDHRQESSGWYSKGASAVQQNGVSCVQGLPLSLSGVRRIMNNMNWGDAPDVVSFRHLIPDQLGVRFIPDTAAPAGSETFYCDSGLATQPVRREEDHGKHGLG